MFARLWFIRRGKRCTTITAKCYFIIHDCSPVALAPALASARFVKPRVETTWVRHRHDRDAPALERSQTGAPALERRYAWECQTQDGGWGLDHVLREHSWKLRGIVNGIDTTDWSPHCDRFLDGDGYCRYDASSMQEGKAACKAALQRVRLL